MAMEIWLLFFVFRNNLNSQFHSFSIFLCYLWMWNIICNIISFLSFIALTGSALLPAAVQILLGGSAGNPHSVALQVVSKTNFAEPTLTSSKISLMNKDTKIEIYLGSLIFMIVYPTPERKGLLRIYKYLTFHHTVIQTCFEMLKCSEHEKS